jgi:predicted nucleic acid-binding protein
MKADVFLDTNVLLYAAADVKQEETKKAVNPFRGVD